MKEQSRVLNKERKNQKKKRKKDNYNCVGKVRREKLNAKKTCATYGRERILSMPHKIKKLYFSWVQLSYIID